MPFPMALVIGLIPELCAAILCPAFFFVNYVPLAIIITYLLLRSLIFLSLSPLAY
jgi:hypothetical protein